MWNYWTHGQITICIMHKLGEGGMGGTLFSKKNISSGNKNALTGPANCKKTTRHHVHLWLCAKSRKTNDAKSRKWPKTSIWAIFFTISKSNISKMQYFLKNCCHSNWRWYLVLTSGQKPKKSLQPLLRKISKYMILG